MTSASCAYRRFSCAVDPVAVQSTGGGDVGLLEVNVVGDEEAAGSYGTGSCGFVEFGAADVGAAGGVFAGRIAQARYIHFQLHPLADLLFVETSPAPAKWVLQRQGRLPSDRVRPPLSQLSDAGRESVQRLLGEAQTALERENPVREPA